METQALIQKLSRYARKVPAGSVIMVEGDSGDTCFIVHSGQFAIIVNQKEINVLGAGAIIGEMALFTDEPRTATVMAIEDSVVIQIEHSQFKTMLQDIPQLAYLLIKVLINRVKDGNIRCVNLMRKISDIKDGISRSEQILYLRIQELEEVLEVVMDSLTILTKRQLENENIRQSIDIFGELEEDEITNMLAELDVMEG